MLATSRRQSVAHSSYSSCSTLNWQPVLTTPLARLRPGTIRPVEKQQPQQQARRHQHLQPLKAQPGGLGDDQADVAVFRFTLGIPGFDDSRVPQVVGAVVAALVALNHFLGAQPAPPAQVRTEFLVILLAVFCFTAPEIEARLREAAPNRGRVAAAGALPGATQAFALAPNLPEQLKVELAWSSRALLVNANCCTVMAAQGGQPLLVRGAVAEAARQQPTDGSSSSSSSSSDAGASILAAVQQSLQQPPSQEVAAVLSGGQQQLYLPDPAAVKAAGLDRWTWLPPSASCLLLVGVAGGGVLVVAGDRPRALSSKDIQWSAAITTKLATCMDST